MIKITFKLATEIIEVIIRGNELMFSDTSGQITTIEGLKLDYSGVIKEFPDLKDSDNWKEEATKRLKEKIKSIPSETKKMEYVKEELIKHGYDALYFQRAGHRPTKFR